MPRSGPPWLVRFWACSHALIHTVTNGKLCKRLLRERYCAGRNSLVI
jgi:hypothetical protein